MITLKPDLIIGVIYDAETDEHVFLRADGSQTQQAHDEWIDGLSSEYTHWLSRINGGPYLRAYNHAAHKFVGGEFG